MRAVRDIVARAAGVAILLLAFALPASSQVTPTDSTEAPKGGKGAIKGSSDTLIITGGLPDDIREPQGGDSTAADTAKAKPRKGSHALKLRINPKKEVYNPRTAALRSALIPGWGQVYNNRIWKVPIVYAGFGAFVAFVIGNHQGYREFDDVLQCKADTNCTDDPYPDYSIETIYGIREEYRRFRDLNVIFCGLWYILNIVDAYVDAHMRGFNVSDDLSLRFDPDMGIDPLHRKRLFVGASITLSLRR